MIGFLGGTGPEGRGLALRLAMVGEEVLLGSRDAGRAEAAARQIRAIYSSARVSGMLNAEAARQADMVFVTVPYAGHATTLSELRQHLEGKVLVDVVAPLAFVKGRPQAIAVEEGSAAQQAQRLVPSARVVAAFHHVSAVDLLVPDRAVNCDVVVCADDAEAKRAVMTLAERIQGVRAIDGGGLACARYVEELTALLLNINRIYKSRAMIKICGI